jgi:hypothetical protein
MVVISHEVNTNRLYRIFPGNITAVFWGLTSVDLTISEPPVFCQNKCGLLLKVGNSGEKKREMTATSNDEQPKDRERGYVEL